MIPQEKLDQLLTRFNAIEANMSGGQKLSSEEFVKLSKEHAELKPVIDSIVAWQSATKELDDLEEIIDDKSADPEMRALAEDEIYDVRKRVNELENQGGNQILQQLLFVRQTQTDRFFVV